MALPMAPSPGGGAEEGYGLVDTALRRFKRQLPDFSAATFPEKVDHATLTGTYLNGIKLFE